jgi:carbonic anhydrase
MVLRHLLCVILLGTLATACSHRRKAVVEEPTSMPEQQAADAQATQTAPAAPMGTYSWTYDGPTGPEAWASVNPDYVQCAQGKKQSPVNLAWRKPTKKGARLDFSYSPSAVAIDVSTPVPQLKFAGGNQMLLNGKVYNLDRIEFHSPSEHQLSKNSMSMEIQFIHKAVEGGKMAALAVFAIEGHDNPLLSDVWSAMASGSANMQFDASKLIPPQKTFYSYNGSLTSPPCSENVDWIVFNTPVELSQQQIMAFRSKFAANSRPLQPLNGRKVTNH